MFIQAGSALTTEIAARSGIDYVLLDQEHGLGSADTLLYQLMAVAGTSCFPIVRLPWNEAPQFKKVLDAGACGVMVPYVETVQQACDAVAAIRYPPHGGIRGVAKTTRATNFGKDFPEYWEHALTRLVLLIQIETGAGVEACEEIARIDGVDVLYVGPTDLSVSLGGGMPLPFDDHRLVAARQRVAAACKASGKAAGILCLLPEHVPIVQAEGFTFITLGSDVGVAAAGIRSCATAMRA